MNSANFIRNGMLATVIKSAVVAGLLGLASTGFAAEKPEFDSMCALGLVMGEKIKTDCSVSWTNPQDGKLYCFSNEAAKSIFLQDSAVHLRKAKKEFGRQ